MTEIQVNTLQDVVERIDKAYKLFFKFRDTRKITLPSFKKIYKYKSFTAKQSAFRLLDGNRIRIGSRIYKYHKSRNVEGIPKNLIVKRNFNGDIYIFIVADLGQQPLIIPRTGKSVGYDFGLKSFLVDQNGNKINAPLFFDLNCKKLRILQKKTDKKQLHSNNWKRAMKSVSKMFNKISNQRKDFHWKTAHEICNKYALICVEDLEIETMAKRNGRKIYDLGFADFIRILEQVAAKTGSSVQKIDMLYPSSQLCSTCGYKNSAIKDLHIRQWICPQCGTSHDRDINAAKNILKVGMSTFFGETKEDQLL